MYLSLTRACSADIVSHDETWHEVTLFHSVFIHSCNGNCSRLGELGLWCSDREYLRVAFLTPTYRGYHRRLTFLRGVRTVSRVSMVATIVKTKVGTGITIHRAQRKKATRPSDAVPGHRFCNFGHCVYVWDSTAGTGYIQTVAKAVACLYYTHLGINSGMRRTWSKSPITQCSQTIPATRTALRKLKVKDTNEPNVWRLGKKPKSLEERNLLQVSSEY